MDEISTKALIIGFSLFITLVITTTIVLEFSQIQSMYKNTAETDLSFEARLDELDKYRDESNYFNGLDVKNTLKKYNSDPSVDVCIDDEGVITCNEAVSINPDLYNKEYKSSFMEEGNIMKIIFEKESP